MSGPLVRRHDPPFLREHAPLLAVLIAVACTSLGQSAGGQERPAAEAARLARVLGVGKGNVVAEVGAGRGEMTIEMARLVGEAGRVYSTELGDEKVEQLRDGLGRAGVTTVTVLDAAETSTNLPAACCDAIFLRRVYHHLTQPDHIDASLLASLRPGGRLAIIDFDPRGGVPPPGVPANRKGHGVPAAIVVEEVTRAGFEHVRTEDWTEGMYLALFRKAEAKREPR